MGRRRWRVSAAAVTGTVAMSLAAIAVGQAPPPPDPARIAQAAPPSLIPSTPRPASPELLALGRRLYDKQCAACHGADGRGAGEAAYLLYPKPRNFVDGAYRLVSTWERVPTDEDLYRTISRGMPGSAMPSWSHLSEEERWALVHCSPNDTHACRVRAFVRNGIVTRLGNTYDYQTYADPYGNRATANWNPRQCAKGYTFHRVLYGPYRLKHPIVRKGWKAWADAGFPELTPELRAIYMFDARGQDEFVQIAWEDAFACIAKALVAIAERYSGPRGRERLLAQGYQPEMVEATGGAGTRCIKMRGGMGLLGVIGKYGMYRLNNSLALLDARIRGVDAKDARAGRNWSNYTWHGDQAPGQPWVRGLQTSDCDFNDLRFSKLIVMDGKNLVENKLTDSHWFIECMERGAKIVVIAPEYGPPSTKADYWIPIRPQTDAALWLGVTRLMIERQWYDPEFVRAFTDFPLLVRTDTLRRLRAAEVFPGYRSTLGPDGPSMRVQGLTAEQHAQLGDYVVWDETTKALRAVTRDDVGARLKARRIVPALDRTLTVKLVDGTEVQVATLWALYRTHLADYDLDTVAEITQAPKALIRQLAEDIATLKPVAIHQGEAIERYENPDRELTAVLQLFRRSNRIIFGYKVLQGPKVYEGTLRGRKVTLYDDTVIAYGKDGRELFRTTVEEPIHVRPARHANSI
jgi:anaerobic selenocysteine-containing dehydrogenase